MHKLDHTDFLVKVLDYAILSIYLFLSAPLQTTKQALNILSRTVVSSQQAPEKCIAVAISNPWFHNHMHYKPQPQPKISYNTPLNKE